MFLAAFKNNPLKEYSVNLTVYNYVDLPACLRTSVALYPPLLATTE